MDFSHSIRTRRTVSNRGFTLIELMVVVVIIGIIASIAVPQIVERLRERRANQAAQEIALVFRSARLRALGQGFAVLVHYDSTGFQIREAMPYGTGTGGCTLQLPLSCLTNPWATAGTDYRVIGGYDPAGYPGVTNTLSLANGTAATTVDVCYTPRGHTYFRTNTAAPLLTSTGMMSVAVTRTSTNRTRTVSILPNGMARLAL